MAVMKSTDKGEVQESTLNLITGYVCVQETSTAPGIENKYHINQALLRRSLPQN